jgi:hypothetical protein
MVIKISGKTLSVKCHLSLFYENISLGVTGGGGINSLTSQKPPPGMVEGPLALGFLQSKIWDK